MAHSPTDDGQNVRGTYRAGWKAVFRMMKEGLSWSGREANCVFLNSNGESFADISGVSGLDFKDDARGLAVVDWDHDGRLDLWLSNRSAPQARFMRNTSASPHGFVSLRLRGTQSNSDGIGARVELHLANGPRLIRTLHAGDGYLAQSSKWVHFGIGTATGVERVIVRWPGGTDEEFEGVEPNGHYVIAQGSGSAARWTPTRGPVSLQPAPLVPPPATERTRIVLGERLPMPRLSYRGDDGLRTPHWGDSPRLLNLWASWCAPCVAELTSFRDSADALRAHDLSILALSVDEEEERPAARAMLERIGWPYESGYALPEMLETLNLLQKSLLARKRRLPVPTSFLIDSLGRLAVVYKGPVELDTLLADIRSLDEEVDDPRDRSTPFDGRWLSTVGNADGLIPGLTRELFNHGLVQAAADYFLAIRLPEEGDDGTGPVSAEDYRQSCRQLAQELETLEEYDTAAMLWERALELDPGDETIKARLKALQAKED